MWKSSIFVAVLALALSLVAAGPAAMAAKAQVVDDAGFFSPDAVSKANQRLAEVERKTGRQLRIETYAAIPQELRANYSHENRNKFFTEWAEKRGTAEGISGALVLATRDPAHLQIVVSRGVAQSGVFTTADRDRMRDVLLGAFKARNFDQGLAAAVDQWVSKVGTAEKSTAGAAGAAAAGSRATPEPYRFPSDAQSQSRSGSNAPAASPAPPQRRGIGLGTILFWGVLIFLGLMLLRRLFGGRRHHQQPGYGQPRYDPRTGQPVDPNYDPRYGGGGGYGPGYGGAGAGGFGRGVGGGIIGGLLGSWLGHTMFGGGGSSAHGSTVDPNASGTADPGAGGGVFDEPPSSGFSGDPGGGGDFGGGDTGGGGDF